MKDKVLKTFPTLDEAQLTTIAAKLAQSAKTGDIIALEGDLGAGKSTFARAFLRALGITEDIPSPTFTLVQSYQAAKHDVWHADLYRLNDQAAIEELGLFEDTASRITLIEWPERYAAWPEQCLWISLGFTANPAYREIKIYGKNGWQERLKNLEP
jgi:tRNA threonylcarbamoyl adenosine modification protein YjeE